jgi:hypothetical protein
LQKEQFERQIGRMNESTSMLHKDEDYMVEAAVPDLQAARALLKQDRAQGLAALNSLFRAGWLPEPAPNGRYAGELLALDIAPGLTELSQEIARSWMPWLGKTFDPPRQQGDNLFSNDSRLLARLFNPLYRGFTADSPGIYHAFTFRTHTAPGLTDPDRLVLKIDYDLEGNPSLTIRRVLDELVQINKSQYLGKAHVHWWWGGWQTVAYFTLSHDMIFISP